MENQTAILSGSAAHALNNVLAVLFAASSYLEDENPSPKAIARARSAVNSACATGEALSAGLALLALGSTGLSALAQAHSGENACEYDAAELSTIANSLRSIVGIDAASLERLPAGLKTWLDRDTLQAILVSAGVLLRRRFGKAQEIEFAALAHGSPDRPALAFEFRPVLEPGAAIPALRSSDHPCSIALEQLAPSMLQSGNRLELGERGEVQIYLIAAQKV